MGVGGGSGAADNELVDVGAPAALEEEVEEEVEETGGWGGGSGSAGMAGASNGPEVSCPPCMAWAACSYHLSNIQHPTSNIISPSFSHPKVSHSASQSNKQTEMHRFIHSSSFVFF